MSGPERGTLVAFVCSDQMIAMPRSLLAAIFRLLPTADVCRASLVCRAWHDASYDRELWFERYFARRPLALVPASLDVRGEVMQLEMRDFIRARMGRRMEFESRVWHERIRQHVVRPLRLSAQGVHLRVALLGEPGAGKRTLLTSMIEQLTAERDAVLSGNLVVDDPAGGTSAAHMAQANSWATPAAAADQAHRIWVTVPALADGNLSVHYELLVASVDWLREHEAGIDLALLVASATDVRSMDMLAQVWLAGIAQSEPHVAAMLVLTHADAPDALRAVKPRKAEAIAASAASMLAVPFEHEPCVPVVAVDARRPQDCAELCRHMLVVATRARETTMQREAREAGAAEQAPAESGGGLLSSCVVH